MVKTIAVFGNGGAGKTTVSLAVAAELTKHEKNVLILSPDKTIPGIPVYLPKLQDLQPKHSLGVLFSAPVTEESLKNKIHLHPRNDRLSFMGLISGETTLTYDDFEKDKFVELKNTLDKTPFDYLIVDCTSNLMTDYISLIAVEMSETVIRVLSPDISGIEFSKSTDKWQGGGINFKPEEQIKIINKSSDDVPIAEMSDIISPDYILPESFEVKNKVIAGDTVSDFDFKYGVSFGEKIKDIVTHILKRGNDND